MTRITTNSSSFENAFSAEILHLLVILMFSSVCKFVYVLPLPARSILCLQIIDGVLLREKVFRYLAEYITEMFHFYGDLTLYINAVPAFTNFASKLIKCLITDRPNYSLKLFGVGYGRMDP